MSSLSFLEAAGSRVHYTLHDCPKCTVLFFPGDRLLGQGVPARVAQLQEPQRIAELLHAKFPAPHVYIVLPARYHGCFACYDQFLSKTTASGEPLGYQGTTYKATQQLAALLTAAGGWDLRLPCHLVGFSKGGMVLNQVLAEVAAAADSFLPVETNTAQPHLGKAGRPPHSGSPAPPEGSTALMTALCQLHYVDVGLNCRGAYLTDPKTVRRLGNWCRSHSRVQLILHSSPRQWGDTHRPWIALEKDQLMAMCTAAGVPCQQQKYYEGMKASLEMHFSVLADLQPACNYE